MNSAKSLNISVPRYLVPFHPKQHPHFFTDILIIGSGLAGLRAALAVDPSMSVLVVCKAGLPNSNSVKAQGGIATVWDLETDCFDKHVSDTLIAGGELCDKEVVEFIIKNGPHEIEDLLKFGAHFDRDEQGKITLGREGGHCEFRILHALGDATGQEVMRAVIEEVKKRPNIRIWEDTFALDLLTADGFCRGAVVHWKKEKETELVWAKQTILATGGLGQLYRETTNPDVATADGVAMAYRAGVMIRDMEFVQFHPTVLYIAGGSRSLITEAMRGAGAYLVDKNGYRFMPDYDKRGELAPRDVVSRSIVSHMFKTNHPSVYLELTHLDSAWVYKRFPGIAAVCANFGIDIAHDRIPVRPGAHYSMGGVLVDMNGRTSLKGLWAAGEVASSGLHGANRLASNSLLEALVFGETTGRLASEIALQMSDEYRALPIENRPRKLAIEQCRNCLYQKGCDTCPSHLLALKNGTISSNVLSGSTLSGSALSEGSCPGTTANASGISGVEIAKRIDNLPVDVGDIRNSLKSVMWRQVGVVRKEQGLSEAQECIVQWSRYVLNHQFQSTAGWELQNMLCVSELIIQGALERRETRGSHNREDFPEFSEPAQHSYFQNTDIF